MFQIKSLQKNVSLDIEMARIILLRRTEHYFFNRTKSSFIFRAQEVLLQGQAARQAGGEETFVSSVLSLQKLFTLMAEISFVGSIFLLISFPLLGNITLHYILMLPADLKSTWERTSL